MSGTNLGGVPVYCEPSIDGYRLDLPTGGNVAQAFPVPIVTVSIYNNTFDWIEVTITTNGPLNGNGITHISPGASQSFGPYGDSKITNVDIVDATLTGNGGGIIVVNGYAG